jgi:hypothetical protein
VVVPFLAWRILAVAGVGSTRNLLA